MRNIPRKRVSGIGSTEGEGVEDVGEYLEDEVSAGGGACEGDVLGFGAGFEEGVYCGFGFAQLGWEGVLWEEFWCGYVSIRRMAEREKDVL